mgnify:FL=1
MEEVCQEISLINKSRVVLEGNVNEIKQRFKKTIINVELSNEVLAPISPIYDIKHIDNRMGGGIDVTIQLKDGITIREAVAKLNEEYNLLGFHEILPSMNEIFIETVS